MGASANSAKTTAPAEKKTQKAAAKKTPQQGGLKLVTWAPGAVEEPRTDPRGGRPLDPHTRLAMESRFGHDFGRVRIHTGPEAHRSADLLGAYAYTLSLDVYFQAGQYRPDHPAGQPLLVHELEHVVRAGSRGPEVPKLAPKDLRHSRNIEQILDQKEGRDRLLEQYVRAHPDSIETAEEVLVSWEVRPGGKQAAAKVALLAVLASLDPASDRRVVRLVREKTAVLRDGARMATRMMWENYQSAAYEQAFVQWTEKKLKEERAKRPKPKAGAAAASEPTPRERRYESLRSEAQARLNALTTQSAGLVPAYKNAVNRMMEAARPRIDAQADVLDELSDLVLGGVSEAKKMRMETYADTSLLEKLKTRPPKPQDAWARKEADARLDAAIKVHARKMMRHAPDTLPAGGLNDLYTEEDFWWVNHMALLNIEQGFPKFTAEHTTQTLILQKSAVAENRKAIGLQHNAPFTTYENHGPGQYDIHDEAGEEIVAALPDMVDLTAMFDRRSPRKLLFRRESSSVKLAGAANEAAANDDRLAKLVHGYFGFHQTKRAGMKAHVRNEAGGVGPAPDASRILGALVYENVTATPPSDDVRNDLQAIRDTLEAALHVELRKLKEPVDIDKDVKILRTVDASSKSFNENSAITKEAVDAVLKASKPGMSRQAAHRVVFDAIQRIVLTDTAVSGPMKALMKRLFEKDIGNRSGPWVTLVHRYREIESGEEAWVEVDYRHLHQTLVKTGDRINPGIPIGKVGASGNAVSPHIHMAIRVYKRDPSGQGLLDIGYLSPDEFFPLRRRRPGS